MPQVPVLTPEERARLLSIARAAVTAEVSAVPLPVLSDDGRGADASGVFVTVKCDGELRGCLGTL